jgi:ribosomal protein S18 acetylase RimI-like enzyme
LNLEYDIYFNIITKVPFKFHVKNLNVHFNKLNQLKNYFAPTRFSNEPKLDALSVWLHKLKMIEIYSRKHSELSNLAFFKNSPIGYNICYLTENINILNLYELAIKPEGRNGYCAFNLLRHAVEMLRSTGNTPIEVTTNVYEDNLSSLRFFKAIGFKINSTTYHYNYWNESRNRK